MKEIKITPRPKVSFIAASPTTIAAFLEPHLRKAVKNCDVTVITDLTGASLDSIRIPGVTHCHAPISRKIAPLRDIRAIWRIFRLASGGGYSAVVSVTPKAGLLMSIAAFFARVPVRIHWFTGQVWANKPKPFRFLLKTADRVIATFSTDLLADGKSQRDFLIAERVVHGESCTVLREGSISGVDHKRFRPDPDARRLIRAELEISDDAVVVIFLGRITRDKGVVDLAEALAILQTKAKVHSVWVGADEDELGLFLQATMEAAGHSSHFVGATSTPERFLAAADVLCLPSYREGFGTSVIEAAAVGVPAVVSDIYGLADSVVNGKTGVVFPVGNYRELSACLMLMIDHPRVRGKLARAARARTRESFRQEDIVKEFGDFLARQLLEAGPRV